MPLQFSLEPDRPYFLTRFIDQVDDGQMFDYYGQLYSRPELTPVKAELVDLSEADLRQVSASALADLAEMMEEEFQRLGVESVKTAIYGPDDMPFGLSRIYQAWSESSPELVRVFRDKNEAIEWLSE